MGEARMSVVDMALALLPAVFAGISIAIEGRPVFVTLLLVTMTGVELGRLMERRKVPVDPNIQRQIEEAKRELATVQADLERRRAAMRVE